MDRGGGAPGPPEGIDVVAGLTRWLATERADAAAAARARERWLRQAAEEEATVAGTLLDLAERADVVVLQGPAGRTHRGRVRAVGEDFVALRTATADVLVRVDVVLAIRGEGRPPSGADRSPALPLGLAEAVAALAGDRPRVRLAAVDGRSLAGELRTVGRDVATLRADDGTTVFVPLAAVAELAVVPASLG